MNMSLTLSPLRVLADLVRAGAAVSMVVAFLMSPPVESGIRFGLVFVAMLVPRLAGRIPAPFDLAFCATLLLATWSVVAEWYRVVPWIDWVTHFVTTGAFAALLYLLFARFGLLPGLQDRPLRDCPASVVLLTVALGFAAGSVWELYEWFANNVLGASILVGYDDTIADLLMDGLGSLLAGLGLVAWAARQCRTAGGRDEAAGVAQTRSAR